MSTNSYNYVVTIGPGTTDTIAVLTVDQGGTLAPTATNAYAVYSQTGAEVLNSGTITGGNVDAGGIKSGVGVYLIGGRLENYSTGVIQGGAGEGGYAGGVGVALRYSGLNLAGKTNNYNDGEIYGGVGGAGAAGGTGVYLTSGAGFQSGGGSVIKGGAGGAQAGSGGIGVDVATDGSTRIYGVVSGGAGGGAASDGIGGTGGIGIDVASTAATSHSSFGSGLAVSQNGNTYGGQGGSGAAGGTGIYLQGGASAQNTPSGNIVGGSGGSGSTGYAAGTGGMGAKISAGTLYNYGSLKGGTGGTNTGDGASGNGGVGAYVADGATLANAAGSDSFESVSGSVTGGAGAINGNGGVGVDLAAGATFNNYAAVSGGAGGTGGGGTGGVGVAVGSGTLTNAASGASDQVLYTTFTTATAASITGGNGETGFVGGVGGAGVSVGAGTVSNGGDITGGTGGGSGYYSFPDGAIGEPAQGGAGGVGLVVTGAATLSNTGTIAGGVGGPGGQPPVGYVAPPRSFARDVVEGVGGIGVNLGSSGATLTNSGTIEGGAGGVFHYTGTGYAVYGSTGGAGVSLSAGTVDNSGSISGGSGTNTGGAGVYLNGGTLETSGTIDGGTASGGAFSNPGDAVLFGSVAATMDVSAHAAFGGDIGGFKIGDVIDITNLASNVVQGDFNSSTHVLTTGTDGTLDFAGSFTGEHFTFTTDPGGSGTDITLTAACYRRGTRVRTPHGERRIETLRIGDLVVTRSGQAKPVRWIGRRSYSRRWAGYDLDIVPVRFRPGSLGRGVPARDLWVSPEHAMWIDGMLIAARDVVNGVSIERDENVTEVSYLHLEFDEHEVIFAEGALAESFADDDSRRLFENAAEYRDLYPTPLRFGARYCAPRVEEGEELEAVRRRLAALVRSRSAAAIPLAP
jgi:hypothetical protein